MIQKSEHILKTKTAEKIKHAFTLTLLLRLQDFLNMSEEYIILHERDWSVLSAGPALDCRGPWWGRTLRRP